MSMDAERFVRGSKRLAEILGVSEITVWSWRKKGWLDGTTVVDTGRTIIYDLERVFRALTNLHGPAKSGRRKSI